MSGDTVDPQYSDGSACIPSKLLEEKEINNDLLMWIKVLHLLCVAINAIDD